jgi:glycosyltransferase involved in cell wall biosynthesis
VKDNTLGKNEYENCLQTCDCMLFPYDKGTYQIRGSGIVSEAVAAGKPFICTQGTALEESISHGNGLVASSAAEFARGILKIGENLKVFKENAKMAAGHYRHCMLENPIIRNALRKQSEKAQSSSYLSIPPGRTHEVVLN